MRIRTLLMPAIVAAFAMVAQASLGQGLRKDWDVRPAGPTGKATDLCNAFSPQHVAALDSAGNVIRVGEVYVAFQDPPKPATTALYAAKYAAATGAELWRYRRDAGRAGEGTCLSAVAVAPNGDVFVAGSLEDATMQHEYVARLAGNDGSVMWEHVAAASETASTFVSTASDLALDAAGNVVVIGTRRDGASGAAGYTIVTKYDGATGAVLWDVSRTDADSNQSGLAIAVDPAGDLIGASFDLPGSEIFKLSGSSGASIWTTAWPWSYSAPSGGPELRGLIVDTLGKPVIFGKGIAKFAPDGSLDWQVPLDPSDPSSRAYDAWFAQNGDVLATGSTLNDTRITTARLLSASGAVAWLAHFDSPDKAHAPQAGYSVKKDAAGNVVVAGGIIRDYANSGIEALIAKYDATTGALKSAEVYPDDATAGRGPGLVVLPYTRASYVDGAKFLLRYGEWPLKSAGTMPRKIDFNADGRADIAWRDAAGHYHVWNMLGLFAAARGPDLGAAPEVHLAGDLGGDGRTDFIFRHPDDHYDLWALSGDTVATNYPYWLPSGSSWTVVATAKFDDDAAADVLMHTAEGLYSIMLMDARSCCFGYPKESANVTPPGADFEVVQVGDFDGDGRDDLLWRHPDGRVVIMLMNGVSPVASAQVLGAGSGWAPVLLGDFNGDGKADILWRHFNGSYGIWLVNGTAIAGYSVLLGPRSGWTATMAGDLDGDGKHDIVWSHANGSQGAWLMDGMSIKSYAAFVGAGSPWRVVRSDDFDFDGKADLLWRNTASNQYGIWLMNGLAALCRSRRAARLELRTLNRYVTASGGLK